MRNRLGEDPLAWVQMLRERKRGLKSSPERLTSSEAGSMGGGRWQECGRELNLVLPWRGWRARMVGAEMPQHDGKANEI